LPAPENDIVERKTRGRQDFFNNRMKRMIPLTAHGHAQRITALTNLMERLQARPFSHGKSELVGRRNDRDRAQRNRLREGSRAALGQS
jgi:hypothetical protein